MHFWIDKRSPQCGFGRSRVAASLHTGGSGLSFGHPPRRSGGHKSSSSSGGNTSLSASSNAGIQVHRQQQQQVAAAAQYHTQQHAATTSNNVPYRSSTQYASGSNSSSNNTTSNNNNNSNTAANQATNRNFVRSNQSNHHHYYNNNRQQAAHHNHHHQQQQQQQQQSSACVLPNSSNNNLTSPTGSNLHTSLNNATTNAPTAATTITTGTQQQQQHAQRYRHPQFGNMSVRTYQPTMQQPTTTTTTNQALISHPQQQLQQQHQMQLQQSATTNATTTTTNNTLNHHTMPTTTAAAAAATTNQLQQSLDASLNTLNEHGIHQSPNQTANLSAELYHQTSPRIVNSFNRPLTAATMTSGGICDYSNVSANSRTTYTNSALQTTTTNLQQLHHHHQQHSSRQRRNTRSIESTDLQFLPLHLKCGIFASLVLAIAFIVGIKVYFDNHGTKFEVGLFWLLTATFVFAFCFVSICKVPRVLFASTTSSRSNSRDQTRGDRCSMDDAVARGSMVNSIDDVVITGLHEFQQEQIQSININAQAGPPPYHIAILLPETKAKEDISTLEESPPPSYDKILI